VCDIILPVVLGKNENDYIFDANPRGTNTLLPGQVAENLPIDEAL
jgi:hypothetical protein